MKALLLMMAVLATGVSPAVAQKVGNASPELSGTDLEGNPVQIAGLQGQVVVLDFWASWCGPCREELPFLAALAEELRELPVTFVGINVDESDESRVAMLEALEVQLPFTQMHDPEGKNAEAFQLAAMPSTVLIDREGVIRYRHAGFRAKDGEALRAAILELVETK